MSRNRYAEHCCQTIFYHERWHHSVESPASWVKSMLAKEKSGQDRHGAAAENRAMVSAIFGAVAAFAEPAEHKLKSVILAGKIAEAFLAGSNAEASPLARAMQYCEEINPMVNARFQTAQPSTADSKTRLACRKH